MPKGVVITILRLSKGAKSVYKHFRFRHSNISVAVHTNGKHSRFKHADTYVAVPHRWKAFPFQACQYICIGPTPMEDILVSRMPTYLSRLGIGVTTTHQTTSDLQVLYLASNQRRRINCTHGVDPGRGYSSSAVACGGQTVFVVVLGAGRKRRLGSSGPTTTVSRSHDMRHGGSKCSGPHHTFDCRKTGLIL